MVLSKSFLTKACEKIKTMLRFDVCLGGGMVDVTDSKSVVLMDVRVRVSLEVHSK